MTVLAMFSMVQDSGTGGSFKRQENELGCQWEDGSKVNSLRFENRTGRAKVI